MTLEQLKELANKAADLFLEDKVSSPSEGVLKVLADLNLTDQQIQRVCELTNKAVWRKLYLKGGKDRTYGFELVDSKKIISTLKGKKVTKERQEQLAKTKGAAVDADKQASLEKAASDSPSIEFELATKREELLAQIGKNLIDSLPGKDIEYRSKTAEFREYCEKRKKKELEELEKYAYRDRIAKLIKEARDEIHQALAFRKYTPEEIRLLFDDVRWCIDILQRYEKTAEHGVRNLFNPRDRLYQLAQEINKYSSK